MNDTEDGVDRSLAIYFVDDDQRCARNRKLALPFGRIPGRGASVTQKRPVAARMYIDRNELSVCRRFRLG